MYDITKFHGNWLSNREITDAIPDSEKPSLFRVKQVFDPLPLPSIQHLRQQGELSPGFPGQCLGDSGGFCELSYESEFT